MGRKCDNRSINERKCPCPYPVPLVVTVKIRCLPNRHIGSALERYHAVLVLHRRRVTIVRTEQPTLISRMKRLSIFVVHLVPQSFQYYSGGRRSLGENVFVFSAAESRRESLTKQSPIDWRATKALFPKRDKTFPKAHLSGR